MKFNKSFIITILIFILLAIIYFNIPIFHNYAKVTIINNSDSNLSDFNISLFNSSQKRYFKIIKINEHKKIVFKDFSDTHYVIKYKLHNKLIKKEVGYLTNGLNFKDTIIINTNSVKLISPPTKWEF